MTATMPRHTAFALALLFPSFAAAQTPVPPPAIGVPAAIGKPHLCGHQYYPVVAIRENIEGTTTVGFTVQKDGAIRDIHVEQSSGSDILDDASTTCVTGWTYKPAMRNGDTVEVPWKASVRWSLHNANTPPSRRAADSYRCAEHHAEPGRATQPLPLRAELSIDETGAVTDATIKVSSGDTVFDGYVRQCMRGWRYNPATQGDGTPVEGSVMELAAWDGAAVPPNTFPRRDRSGDDCKRHPLSAPPAGHVHLGFWVEKDGSVTEPILYASSGSPDYDAYVQACVSKWKYHPAMDAARPSRMHWEAEIAWTPSP
jgi:TonB family protein